MKRGFLLMIIMGAVASAVMAQSSDCEYMLDDANKYYKKGEYKKALAMFTMLGESHCMDATTKIKECNRLIQEDEDYKKCYTISGCESYMKKYPKGRYYAKVQKKQSDLLAKEMANEEEDNAAFSLCDNELACDEYLEKYPRGRHLDEVLAMKLQFQQIRDSIEAVRRLEWEAEASKTAYMDIQEIEFANFDVKKNIVINDYGSTLYSSDLKFLTPNIVYDGIYDLPKFVTIYCKLYNPNGNLMTAPDSPYGYTFEDYFLVKPGNGNNKELRKYGNSTISGLFESGDYLFELYYQDSLIYQTPFTISDKGDALTVGRWRNSLSKCFDQATQNNKDLAYKGQVDGRKRSGLGALMFKNEAYQGTYYIGEWKESMPDGTGIFIVPDGKNQLANCEGAMYYVGEMSKNLKSGKGRCYNKFGELVYEGNFANDAPTQTYPTENKSLRFECLDYALGCYYVGETKDGKCHGKGMLIWRWDNEIWYGTFVDGERNGYGILLLNDGNVTTGIWKGDEKK